jgi:gamma-tubulin complex component 5
LTPDVLSFILQLSDQPLTKSSVEDLELLKPPEPPPPLTWSDIVRDDPLTEEGIWENVDFTADSSDDGYTEDVQELSVLTEDNQGSSASNENPRDIRAFLVTADNCGLEELQKAQFWVHQVPAKAEQVTVPLVVGAVEGLWLITELQVVREVLFMLSGLPTSLFQMNTSNGKITWDEKYTLSHSSQPLFHKILGSFAMFGEKLGDLRNWVKTKQTMLLMQTFRASVEGRLREYNTTLSDIQERFITPTPAVVVSLIEIHTEIQYRTRPLLELSTLITKLRSDSKSGLRKFQSLELLFDSACLHQMIGDEQIFQFMAKLFFECFQTYLKPIRLWMKEGNIQGHDDTFFIAANETAADADLDSIWHDQYILRQDDRGKIQAPKFLHAAANKIFNTGKSVVFLKQLGGYNKSITPENEPILDFHTVCQSDGLGPLAPFSELFDTAFDNWIKSKHQMSSQILRERLFSDCGLWRSLDALEYIYFHRDGALFTTISATLFEKIDRGKEAWNDQFLLTELVQSVFGGLKCVDAKKLTIRSQPGKYGDIHNRRRSVKILNSVSITYSVSIPTFPKNIVTNLRSFHGQLRMLSKRVLSPYISVSSHFSFRYVEQCRCLNASVSSRMACGLQHLMTMMTVVKRSYSMLSVTAFCGFQTPSTLTSRHLYLCQTRLECVNNSLKQRIWMQ